ncbi:DpnI domain-containing protein [Alloiococcus sp. CFN-8]|uniref:DpnI domain-containing protein n=1 Tax=Alloiococcus sp. CFN-8 TaxID=3416081 RepID=UPI003CEB5A37
MDLNLISESAAEYRSGSQKARIITEEWGQDNLFCPYCGNKEIKKYANNMPVADFYCDNCHEEYELKSKSGAIANKVPDGAYGTMIERINAVNNPNFFFMQYSKRDFVIDNLIIVPKHFFKAEIIEKRKPLVPTARRAGWIGCNILIRDIPKQGKIYVIKNSIQQPVNEVIDTLHRTNFIADYSLDKRGWLIDILSCINRIRTDTFNLQTMYSFEGELQIKHPENNHIKAKIRQQLQLLRDKGIIEFLGRGVYKKL